MSARRLFVVRRRRLAKTLRLLCAGLLAAVSAASFPACLLLEEAPSRVLAVSVTDEDGRPLAGRAVEIDGLAATTTARDGVARVALSSAGPPRVRVGVSCPAGSRELPPRHVPRLMEGGTARLELSFRCRPSLRELAVVVRAPGGEGLWLRADGEPIGRVAADGTLHAKVVRPPDSEVRLLLDTGDLPLSPPNPVRELRVADRDELVIFDQALTSAKPRVVDARRTSSAVQPALARPRARFHAEATPLP